MSDQGQIDPRVKVQKAFLHPAAPGGAPVWVTVFNLVWAGITLGMLHWPWGLAICFLVQGIFAWFGRKHPFQLRYVVRNYWRPINYLDN